MKKLVLSLALLSLGCLGFAQGRHSIALYLSGGPTEYLKTGDIEGSSSLELANLFSTKERYESGPGATLDYNFALLGWLHLGAQVNYSEMEVTQIRRVDAYRMEFVSSSMSLLPQVKFMPPVTPHFRPYAKVAVGVGLVFGHPDGTKVVPEFDIVPVGFEWGKSSFYGIAEACAGSVFIGGRIGMGLRF